MKTLKQGRTGWIIILLSIILLTTLGFIKADLDESSAFLCEAVHSNPNLEMSQCPVHQSNSSWLMTLAFGVGFLFLGTGLYRVFASRKATSSTDPQFKEVDVSTLDKDEKHIYQLLFDNEGSLYQSDLIKKTDFTKVRITRILDKMELKGILERKRRGMTNIIVLK